MWLGLAVVLIALPTAAGVDLLGWVASPRIWLNPIDAVRPVSPKYAVLPGLASLLFTYLLVLGLVAACAAARKIELRSFIPSFTAIFWVSAVSLLIGHYAYIAQTPDKRSSYRHHVVAGSDGRGGLPGRALGRPGRGELLAFGRRLAEAGGPAGVVHQDRDRASGSGARRQGGRRGGPGHVDHVPRSRRDHRGVSDLLGAGLPHRTEVLPVQPGVGGPAGFGDLDLRRLGRHHDGGGDPCRPVVPIMVSSLVVIFSVVELLVLPLAAREFLWKEPLVAAAWMGLAVKTDGAAVASGAITDALIRARALEAGVAYEAGWILTTTTTVKVFIDVFIGIWALVLSLVWTYGIERKPGANGAGARGAEAIPGLRLRVFRPVPCSARPDAGPAGTGPGARRGHCPDRALARALLRDDVLHDRDGFRPQTPLGRRDRPARPGLRRQPLRLHHLDRTGDLVAVLPWSSAADHSGRALN